MRGERLCHKMTGVGDALTFNYIPCITADEYCFYVRPCPADYVIYIHAVHFQHNHVKQQQVIISFMSDEFFKSPVSVSCSFGSPLPFLPNHLDVLGGGDVIPGELPL